MWPSQQIPESHQIWIHTPHEHTMSRSKNIMNTSQCIRDITQHNALRQSIIGISLLSVIPAMTLVYASAMLWLEPDLMNRHIQMIIYCSILAQATAGFLLILKFPRNIIRLRQCITEVASGTLPEQVRLLNTRSSDDLQFIEQGLNLIIQEMKQQVAVAQQKEKKERALRETIERQQDRIVKDAQRRAMVQSIGAACHHIGQPMTIMGMRLHLIKMMDHIPEEERAQIVECEKLLYEIMNILEKMRRVEEFKTERYIDDRGEESRILAI